MLRRSGGIAAGAVLAVLVLVLAVGPAAGDNGSGPRLSKEDQATLAHGGTVTMLLEVDPASTDALAAAVQQLGGHVRYSDGSLGYLRVDVDAAKADAVAALPGVQGAGLDQVFPLSPVTDSTDTLGAPPDAGTPAANPYLPTQDVGAPQFVAANPTFDGRGVVVGILDTGVDPSRPELQTAETLGGRPVRKLVDWTVATDPTTDGDGSWIQGQDVVATGQGATFSAAGQTWTAPRPGHYLFGVFSESALCPNAADPSCEMHNDVGRDGSSNETFGVLWRPAGGEGTSVWVDVNRNGSFADEQALGDFRRNGAYGYFGNASDPTARVPFTVQVDKRDGMVALGLVSAGHGTHVAGIVAGTRFFGSGQFTGVAPGAQLASVRACRWPSGCTSHALVEGMIQLAVRDHADVINVSVGSLPFLNDGNNARCALYDRLTQLTGTTIVVAAGNTGPGGNTVADPAVCDGVISVAASVSGASYAADLAGAGAVKPDSFAFFSARGPREDGALAPLVAAPGIAFSTFPAWDQVPGETVEPGYAVIRGTSQAAPEVAGAAALLLSAARQSHVPVTPAALRQALVSSARFVPGYGPDVQGNGIVQVGAAWDLLKQGIRTTRFQSSARVATVLSSFLRTPGQGNGLYVREGWAAGAGGTETITFTRLSGPSGAVTYTVGWKGDPAFSSASAITLPLGQPVPLQVSVAPLALGLHSAIVTLDDPSTPGIDYETMATVDASTAFGPSWSASAFGSVDTGDSPARLLVNVPSDAGALVVVGGSHTPGSKVRLHVFSPAGVEAAAPGTGIVVPTPQAGVWEVDTDASYQQAVPTAADAAIATLYGVRATPAATTSATQTFTLQNLYGGFKGQAVGTPLQSAFTASPTIADGQQQSYPIQVPAGATSLSASIGRATQPSADLDLVLFDCTTGTCVEAQRSAGGTSDESVQVANPAAGLWKAVVLGSFVPTGTTGYVYQDAYAQPGLGSVSVTDAPAGHGPGSTWTVDATATATGSPGAGRFLQGFVKVVATTAGPPSLTVGQAEIDLR